MTTGTKIVESALQKIGAHSVLQPANPESLEQGKNTLNAMIAQWEDNGILMGCVPLKVIGSELSEPHSAKNGIIYNLAIALAPDFPGSQVSNTLQTQANKTYNLIKRIWKEIDIPRAKARGTYPRGQGHKTEFLDSWWDETFFEEGQELGKNG